MPNSIHAPVSIVRNQIKAPVMLARDAYQLAVLEGYVGTRTQWLASIGSGGGSTTVVSATPPGSPTTGDQWYDPDFGVLSSWDGSAWVTEAEQPFGFVFGHSYCPDPGTLCTIPVYAAADAVSCNAGHPSVVYVPGGVGGHKYWMAMTPLKTGVDDFENPSIMVSDDGVTWTEPVAESNPIVQAPALGFNADTNLTWEGDRFVLLYTEYGVAYRTFYLTSPDGVTWTAPALLRSTVPATAINASPSLHKAVDGTYMLWSVDVAGSPKKIVLSTSASLDGPWVTADCTVDATLEFPWHLDVIRFGGQYVMLLDMEDVFGRHQLVWMRSLDGISWNVHPDFFYPIAWNGDAGEVTGYYKSAFVLGPHFGSGNVGKLWHNRTDFTTMKVAAIKEVGSGDFGPDYVSDGIAPLGTTKIHDTFPKANGALAGTFADTGQQWLAAGTQILIDANKIKMGSPNSYAAIDLGAEDGLVGVRFSTMPYTGLWEIEARSKRSNGAKRIGLQYNGKRFYLLVYNGSSTVHYAQWVPPVIDGGNLDGFEFTLQFVGRVVTARMNGRVMAQITISESDQSSLSAQTNVSLYMGDATTRIDRFFAHT